MCKRKPTDKQRKLRGSKKRCEISSNFEVFITSWLNTAVELNETMLLHECFCISKFHCFYVNNQQKARTAKFSDYGQDTFKMLSARMKKMEKSFVERLRKFIIARINLRGFTKLTLFANL